MQRATPGTWDPTAPWLLVVAVVVIVIGLKPGPAAVESCTLLLAGASQAYRSLAR
ncbi:hypothetical protein [Streptomyces misionensis]|uniref:hypothetical protein n=1 Tax=Streptomyces misionensis TaxID=67331 RepID=UPI0036ABBBF4